MSQLLEVNEPATNPITCPGKTLPNEITAVPIETVRVPSAIPIIANLIGVKSFDDINLDNINETINEEIIEPKNIQCSSKTNIPA